MYVLHKHKGVSLLNISESAVQISKYGKVSYKSSHLNIVCFLF